MKKEIKSIVQEVLNQNAKILKMNIILLETLSKPVITVRGNDIVKVDIEDLKKHS